MECGSIERKRNECEQTRITIREKEGEKEGQLREWVGGERSEDRGRKGEV